MDFLELIFDQKSTSYFFYKEEGYYDYHALFYVTNQSS